MRASNSGRQFVVRATISYRLESRHMEAVTVSPKFQVVIPLAVRQALGLQVGQKLHVMRYGDRVELMPVRLLSQARGFLAGIDSDVPREGDRV